MFTRVLCIAAVLALSASIVSATTIQWVGAGYSDAPGAWEDGSNWNSGIAPIATDNIVKLYGGSGSNITISSDVSGGIKLQMKSGQSKLTINNGGTLTNLDGVEMFTGTSSEVDILAGGIWNACTSTSGANFSLTTSAVGSKDTVSVWGTLNVDGTSNPSLTIGTTTNANGQGTVNIYGGGVVYTDRYTIGAHGIVNMWSGSTFKINGDVSSQINTDALAGKIVAIGGTLQIDTTGTPGYTVVTVPEPATLVLLGLGGLLLRRKR